jgi:hypothetical protein
VSQSLDFLSPINQWLFNLLFKISTSHNDILNPTTGFSTINRHVSYRRTFIPTTDMSINIWLFIQLWILQSITDVQPTTNFIKFQSTSLHRLFNQPLVFNRPPRPPPALDQPVGFLPITRFKKKHWSSNNPH